MGYLDDGFGDEIVYFDPEVRRSNFRYVDALLCMGSFDWKLLELALSYLTDEWLELFYDDVAEFVESLPDSALFDEMPRDSSDLIGFLQRYIGNLRALEHLRGMFPDYWKASRSEQPADEKGFAEARRLLSDLYKLSDLEVEVLVFIYSTANCRYFNNFISGFDFKLYVNLLAQVLGERPSRVRSVLRDDSRLIGMGLIRRDYLPPPHFSTSSLMDDLFLGMADDGNAAGPVQPIGENSFSLDSFPVPREDTRLMQQILTAGKSRHILLYGMPGTGKTAFAKSLVNSTDLQGMQFSTPASVETHNTSPFQILRARNNLQDGQILIVDEADRLLNSESNGAFIEKGWLVSLLDTFKVPTVWIVNDVDGLHPAIKRRFSYSREFRSWTPRQRRALWKNIVDASPLAGQVSDTEISRLSRRFPADAGGITLSLESTADLYADGSINKDEIQPVINRILSRHTRMTRGWSPDDQNERNIGPYDPSLVRTDVDIEDLPGIISRYTAMEPSDRTGGLNLLFWGAPGTGKTAYARYLSEAVDLPLITRRASDLMSKWVGDSEKLIAGMFAEMDGGGSIVLLDEADSMLSDRSGARQSWERSQTNELLTHMERHKGVFICCTNAKDILDPAVMRRLAWKVRFSPLDAEGLYSLFVRYFGFSREDSDRVRFRLMGLKGLTPGDYGILWKRYRFQGLDRPVPERVVDDLEAELSYRTGGRSLGFKAS